MNTFPISLLAALAAAASVVAQEATLPAHSYFTQGTSATTTWRATAFRCQNVYDTQNLIDQGINGPISITRLRFRAADGATHPGGSLFGTVNVQLSSCPANYLSISTTFLTNRGADNQICYAGPVTTQPVFGGTPNDWFVDLTLTTPFLYDPTLGQDLVVEVDGTAPGIAPPAAAVTSSRSRRIHAASNTAATGTATSAGSDIVIDFAGPGGWSTWSPATTTASGTGCYRVASSFYEHFTDLATFDLSNTTVTLTPNANGGYDVLTGGATPFHPHGATHLGLLDDDTSVQLLPPAFGAGLPFPTGNTTPIVTVNSNGYISLGADPFPFPLFFVDPLLLLAWSTPLLAPFLANLVPTPTNNVYYDVDVSGTAVYVTYDAVPTSAPGGVCNLQVMLTVGGVIQYRYGACLGASGDVGLVGWSPGNGASDPGGVDLSTVGSFGTAGPDTDALTLDSAKAWVGMPLSELAFNIPASAAFTLRVLAAAPLPGIDLGIIGAPSCPLWVDLNAIVDLGLGVTTPDAAYSIFIPNDLSLFGVTIYTQALSFVVTANPLGIITSNQSALTMGNS